MDNRLSEKKFDEKLLINAPICFMDILGFSDEIVQIRENNLKKAKEIGKLLYELKYHPNIQEYQKFGVEILAFSDSIIISHRMVIDQQACEPEQALMNVILAAKTFQQLLVIGRGSWLSRGYIAEGLIYHKDDIIFGPAYITAFKQESKHHEPKIIVEKSIAKRYIPIQETIEQAPKLIRVDNGPYFIDYLEGLEQYKKINPIQCLKRLIDMSLDRTKKFSDKTGVSEKYQWFTQYARSHRDRLGI